MYNTRIQTCVRVIFTFAIISFICIVLTETEMSVNGTLYSGVIATGVPGRLHSTFFTCSNNFATAGSGYLQHQDQA